MEPKRIEMASHNENTIANTRPPVVESSQNAAAYTVGIRTMLAIFALALANCNATLSNTTNTIIKFQIQAVGGASEASWIANGNFLLTLALAPIFGSLADRLGKKWFVVGGCALGVVGSFVSSSAKTVYTLISGNVVVGIANAGCIVSIAANQEIIPNKFRPYAFGFSQTVNSIGAIVGTFLAAVFAEYSTWAWSYR
jgi:MFS family permease